MKTFRVYSTQDGLTLIEVLIAMLIGIVLMAGILQVFVSAKQAYRLQENLSRLQENGRFAMDFITRDLRMAGYMGCAKAPIEPTPHPVLLAATIGNTTNVKNLGLTASTPIVGTDLISEKTKIYGIDDTAISGGTGTADTITVQYAQSCGGQLAANMTTAGPNSLVNTNTCGISNSASSKNNWILIADCTSSDVYMSNVSGNTISYTPSSPVVNIKNYNTDAEAFLFQHVIYSMAVNSAGIYGINRAVNLASADNLIEGIENMQILYGVDNDQTPDYVPNYYAKAGSVPATITTNVTSSTTDAAYPGWGRVVSVRISLLAVSVDDYLTDKPQPYTFNGVTTTPTDRKLRRVFSSTIAVRNRLP